MVDGQKNKINNKQKNNLIIDPGVYYTHIHECTTIHVCTVCMSCMFKLPVRTVKNYIISPKFIYIFFFKFIHVVPVHDVLQTIYLHVSY